MLSKDTFPYTDNFLDDLRSGLYADDELIGFLNTWISKNKDTIDNFSQENALILLEYADEYIRKNSGKPLVKELNSDSPRTPAENIDLSMKSAERLAENLKGYSPKGHILREMLLDLIDNPKDYFAPTYTSKADFTHINSFFRAWKIPKEAQKEFKEYLKLRA